MLTELLLSILMPFLGSASKEMDKTNQVWRFKKVDNIQQINTPLSSVYEAFKNLKIKEEIAKNFTERCYNALSVADNAF